MNSYGCAALIPDKLGRLRLPADINFMVMKFLVVILKLSLVGMAFTVIGCSSPPKDIRQRVSKGMDKDDVLEVLGNPSRSKRVRGADRWSYDHYKDDLKTTTHVYFKSGKVSEVIRDDQLVKELKELSQQKKKDREQEKSKDFRDL